MLIIGVWIGQISHWNFFCMIDISKSWHSSVNNVLVTLPNQVVEVPWRLPQLCSRHPIIVSRFSRTLVKHVSYKAFSIAGSTTVKTGSCVWSSKPWQCVRNTSVRLLLFSSGSEIIARTRLSHGQRPVLQRRQPVQAQRLPLWQDLHSCELLGGYWAFRVPLFRYLDQFVWTER